jgi:enamine deaminase RidA (YjgF/YER057c/UK114 family)
MRRRGQSCARGRSTHISHHDQEVPVRAEIMLPESGDPISHYTDAVRFGDLLFISGIAPLDGQNLLVAPGDVVAQAEFVFAKMGRILEHAGGSYANVLRVTVYLINVDDRTRINPTRQRVFGATRPASTLIEVSALAVPGMLVEVEAVAGIPAPVQHIT